MEKRAFLLKIDFVCLFIFKILIKTMIILFCLSLPFRLERFDMKKTKLILSFIFTILLLISCSEPTMDDDAQKAAELSAISNNYAMNNEMEKAGKIYQEVQGIIEKYKKQDKFAEFYKLYSGYLEYATYDLMGGEAEAEATE